MKLTKSKFFILSYRPLILAYAGGTESKLDVELLVQGNTKPIVLQFISWWAGNEGSMVLYRDYQQWLEEQGIEHHLMVNSPDEDEMRRKQGVRGALCSKNLFCDENVFRVSETEKVYEAIYVARLQHYKRLNLARGIKRLLVLSYGGDLPSFCPDLAHAVYNKAMMPSSVVADMMSQSVCGLCLSEVEGQMRAAVEYLLCGIPVITTPSRGGRDLFFDESNSLIVSPNATDVVKAVNHWKASSPDASLIRSNVLLAINKWRNVLTTYVADLIKSNGGYEVDLTNLKTRLFEVPECLNDRLISHPLINDSAAMANYAIENHSLKVIIKPGIRIGEAEANGVLVENESGDLVNLDSVSTAVLKACYQAMRITDILELFRNSYPDAPESLENDIIEVLESLFSSSIIDIEMVS